MIDNQTGKSRYLIFAPDDRIKGAITKFKNIQKEILRIYGEPFDFCRKTVICDKNLPLEELLGDIEDSDLKREIKEFLDKQGDSDE